ncbi:hypothetical protein OB952_07795 [Aeromonas salmonicida]|uniref:hypothetical protein n=1 Tax=Aeromonas salmonicida TaxID=645 RepID=UPI00259F13C0|nr:hypothetical protein [Aeromonas salmonicida]MDM5067267.1 hypothetical protein [Aeromonas salmonicida]
MKQRISQAEVKRDEMGFWIHPEFPDFGETLGGQFTEWQQEQGIACSFVSMEDDLPEGMIERFTFCATCSDERSRIAPWACGKKGRHFIAKEVA